MQTNHTNNTNNQQEREVLSKAVICAGELLGLRNTQVSDVLGVSKSTVSRMSDGSYLLKRTGKEWELAALLVRLYRSLDAIMGGDEKAMHSWLNGYKSALSETPKNLITHVTGLTRTVDYVDAYRARV